MNNRVVILGFAAVVALASIYLILSADRKVDNAEQKGIMEIRSDAFENGGVIPAKYTCDGENINPQLSISGVPDNAVSLALTVDDPDVPVTIRPDGNWDHWIVWNIPPDTTDIPEGHPPTSVIGNNSSGNPGYQGPCPPDREHRYFFKLYALDTKFELDPQTTTKDDLISSVDGHILEKAELMGRYNRQQEAQD